MERGAWIVIGIFLLTGCGRQHVPVHAAESTPSAASTKSATARVTVPPWTLPDLAGKSQRLDDWRGQVVLLNFWATWCPPCIEEIPDLVQLQKDYQGRGVTVVGIALESGGAEAVQSFMQRMGMQYPVVLGDIDVAQRYRVMGIPASFLLDRTGHLVRRWNGPRSKAVFARQIDAVLAEEAKTP